MPTCNGASALSTAATTANSSTRTVIGNTQRLPRGAWELVPEWKQILHLSQCIFKFAPDATMALAQTDELDLRAAARQMDLLAHKLDLADRISDSSSSDQDGSEVTDILDTKEGP